MKLRVKEIIISIVVIKVLTFYKIALYPLENKNSMAPISIPLKVKISEAFNNLKLYFTRKEMTQDEIKEKIVANAHNDCRELRRYYSLWKKKPNIRKITGLIRLIGYYSVRLENNNLAFGNKDPHVLLMVENFSVPCAVEYQDVIFITQKYRAYTAKQGHSTNAFFELIKLNYNYFSKLNSFKGIEMGLEMLKHGVSRSYLKDDDFLYLDKLIDRARHLNEDYTNDHYMLSKFNEDYLISKDFYFSNYNNQRIVLQIEVKKFLEKLSFSFPGDKMSLK